MPLPMTLKFRAADIRADFYPDAEFLFVFPNKRLFVGFAIFHLSAGKFPPFSHVAFRNTLGNENFSAFYDDARNRIHITPLWFL
jgi:hypothetical protein